MLGEVEVEGSAGWIGSIALPNREGIGGFSGTTTGRTRPPFMLPWKNSAWGTEEVYNRRADGKAGEGFRLEPIRPGIAEVGVRVRRGSRDFPRKLDEAGREPAAASDLAE